MAVFHEPAASVKAAVAMHSAMDGLSNLDAHGLLQLKIGIHHGNVMAVNANQRLDYFGQTVNIAARVQNEGGGREICMSEAVTVYRYHCT